MPHSRTTFALIGLALAACQAAPAEPSPTTEPQSLASAELTAAPAREPTTCDPYLVPGPYDPAHETAAHFERRKMRRLLAQIAGEPLEAPDWPGMDREQTVPILVIRSVQEHLKAAGRTTLADTSGPTTSVRSGPEDHCWLSEGVVFRFNRGEFPVYDELCHWMKLDPATQVPWNEELPPRQFHYAEEFFGRACAFAREALALMPPE